MTAFITTAGLGLLVCVLGIINRMGNISSLHWIVSFYAMKKYNGGIF